MITRNGKHTGGVHILDGMPQTFVHGAEEGATKVVEVVESAGARVAKGAGQVAKSAGQVAKGAGQAGGGRASELSGQLKGQASEVSGHLKGQASDLSGHLKGQASEVSGHLKGQASDLSGQVKGQAHAVTKRRRLLPSGDAMLKAQLVRTSRELAHESSDLNAAVDSLNKLIRTNRRAAAKGRTRLLGGLALGAALMYHLDAEHGRQRRAATARMVTGMWRGQRQTPVV